MAAAGIGRERERPRISGDGSERVSIKSGTDGNTRAVAHPHLGAFDPVGDPQTDREHHIPLPRTGAFHGPPADPPDDGRPAYHPATVADTHVPYTHTRSADDAPLRDHDATDVDRLGSTPQPVDVNASPGKQWAGHHHLVHVPCRCRRRTAHGPGPDRRRPGMLPGLGRFARPQPRTPCEPYRYRQRGELLVPDLVKPPASMRGPVSVLTGPRVQRSQAYNRTEFVGVRSIHSPVEQLLPMSQATLPVALYPVHPCTRAPPVWQFTTVYSPTRFCTLYVP